MDSKNSQAKSNSDVPSTSSRGPESRCPFDNLVTLSFETTRSEYSYDHPYEVIQMAASVLYGPGPEWTAKPETDFSEIVRPTRHPKLTRYTKQLTGISQEDVDKADEFPKVFEKFEKWLETTGVAESNYAIVTETTSIIWKIAQYQFILCNMTLPIYLKRFISISEIYKGLSDRSASVVKPKKEESKCLEEKEPATEEKMVEVRNPQMNNPDADRYDRDDSEDSDQEPYVFQPVDPNDPGLDAFRRGRAEADLRDQEDLVEADRQEQAALAEAVHQEQEGVYTPPETEQSAESDEYNRSAEELAFPNVMDPMEQPRARKRESDESVDSEELRLDNVPTKKIKIAKHSFVERLCTFYCIQRTGKHHNAADDATTLRDVTEEMLKDEKIVFYYNYMLVCYDKRRGSKLQFELETDWRQSFQTVSNFFEKVLPLFCRQIDIKEHVDYTKCITCEKPLEVCGAGWIHRQFPSELFDSSKPSYREIRFAKEAGLDIDKSIQSVSDDVEDNIYQNKEGSDSGEGNSNGGKKDL